MTAVQSQELATNQQISAADQADSEFEQLLEAIPEANAAVPDNSTATEGAASDIITDDEFEALLDQLHGTVDKPVSPAQPSAATKEQADTHPAAPDQITDDEFEAAA